MSAKLKQAMPGYELKDVTGVYSRAAFNIMLQDFIEKGQQGHQNFALLLLDLDHFKSINDAFGHAFGDRVLTDFAHRLQSLSRGSDLIFRYGGDEFVILLDGASKPQAVAIATRLLNRITEVPFETAPPLTLSISVGVVNYPDEGQTAEELFEIADRRHYIAKRSGRGRVISEDPLSEQFGIDTLYEHPSRLIDRDQPLEIVNRFLAGMPEAQRGLLTIFGVPGSGKSRFLSEVRKIARLQGYAVLPIRGTPAVKTRMYGALDIARLEIENLPPPSNGLQVLTQAIQQSLIDKGNAGLLVTINNLARIDRFTLEYLSTQLIQNVRPICVIYASEDMSKSTDSLREKLMRNMVLNESVTLVPISAAGLRIWLRQCLHWEAPRAFIEWFQRETGGLPSKITRGIQYIIEHSVIKQTASGRDYLLNIENLHLDPYINIEAVYPVINFPTGITAFIGREEELKSIKQLLVNHRLVTVLGPGGSGKSRLSLQASTELWEKFPDGIYFIPLASLSEPGYLITTLASFLQIPLAGVQDPKKPLIHLLAQKKLLLVLDNFENLIQGAELLSEILEQTTGVRMLVTSRERLDLPEEMVVEIGGLKYPEADTDENIEHFSAVQLFTLSAQRSRSDFSLTPENKPHVARICHMVSGMPLGIELAAAWVQTFEPGQIAEKIEESLSFLASDLDGIPDTQRSIQAVLASFWDSLSKNEQEIVCQLSVFKTRFSEAAARKVAGASPFFLDALVARSFLRKTPRGFFEMHGLLRQFAAHQLAKDPAEVQATLSRHCAFFTQFIQQRSKSIKQGRQSLDDIDQEIDNIRAAWQWALTNNQTNFLAQSARTLQTYYALKGYMVEAHAVFQQAADHIKRLRSEQPGISNDAVYVGILAILASYHNWLNNYDQTSQVIEEAYPIAIALGNNKLLAELLMVWGQRLYMTSDFTAGRVKMESALEYARLAGDRQIEADVLRNLGNIALDVDAANTKIAREFYEQSLEICRRIEDRVGEGGALNNLGLISLYNDRYQEAIGYFEQNLIVARQLGDRITESYSLSNMGTARVYTHEYLQGLQHIKESMKIMHLMGSRQDEGIIRWSMGFLHMCSGNLAEAHQYFSKALTLLHEVNDRASESRALGDFAQLCLFEGHYKSCQQYCEQSIAISQEIGLTDSLAFTQVSYGRALFHLGKINEAEKAFTKAIEVQKEIGKQFMNTESLAGLARIYLHQRHKAQSLQYVEKILEMFAAAKASGEFENVFSGLNDYFEVYNVIYETLKAVKDERAASLLAEGYELLQKFAARSGDEITRQMYLEGIPSHKRLRAEYLALPPAIQT